MRMYLFECVYVCVCVYVDVSGCVPHASKDLLNKLLCYVKGFRVQTNYHQTGKIKIVIMFTVVVRKIKEKSVIVSYPDVGNT